MTTAAVAGFTNLESCDPSSSIQFPFLKCDLTYSERRFARARRAESQLQEVKEYLAGLNSELYRESAWRAEPSLRSCQLHNATGNA
jgi:hypothetical protein